MLASAVVLPRRQTGLLCRIPVDILFFSCHLIWECLPIVRLPRLMLPFTTTATAMGLPRESSHSYHGCAFTPPANEPHLVDTFCNLKSNIYYLTRCSSLFVFTSAVFCYGFFREVRCGPRCEYGYVLDTIIHESNGI